MHVHTGTDESGLCVTLQAIAGQFGAKPQFIAAGTSHFDINQGRLGRSLHAAELQLYIKHCRN